MLRRSRYALVLAVALAWGCDQDGATALRVKTPARPVALATAVGSIMDLGNLPGAASAEGFAINDRGQVVGCSYLQFCNLASGSRDPQRAFLWDPITQHLTDLTLPSTAPSEAFGLNETGQVVGSVNSDGRRAFLWDPSTGTMILISDPLTPGAEAAAINGRGQVVGFGRIRGGLVDHAFLWTPDVPNGTTGSMTDLGTLPGGSGSAAFGVNDRGQVVGCSYTNFCDPTNGSAFLWTPDVPNGTTGSMIDLGTLPGASGSEASGINNGGQVVGASGANFTARAFLWTPAAPNGTTGALTDLGALPGSSGSQAYGINNAGEVVGCSYTSFCDPTSTDAFLWRPDVPNGTTGNMIDLGTLPGASGSEARGINDVGQVVGDAVVNGAAHAVLWTMTETIVPLAITPPGPLTLRTDPGRCDAQVSVAPPTTTGGIPPITLMASPLPPYPAGKTIVTWTATDATGSAATALQSVAVFDPAGFAIVAPRAVTLEAGPGGTASVDPPRLSATIEANCPGGITVTSVRSDGLPIDAPYPLGTTGITFTATDASGYSPSASTTVKVEDTTPPLLTVPGNSVVDATSPSGAVVFYVASARDIAAGVVPVTCRPPSGSNFPIGNTTVTCTASDPSGNTRGSAFAVTVLSAPTQIANLANSVTSLGLQSGIATSLTGKLNAALAAATAGDLVTACRKLQDFINETHAQAGKKISTGDAASLIATAQRIRAVLGC